MTHFNFGRNNGKPAAVTSWGLGDEGGKLRLVCVWGGGDLSLGAVDPPPPKKKNDTPVSNPTQRIRILYFMCFVKRMG